MDEIAALSARILELEHALEPFATAFSDVEPGTFGGVDLAATTAGYCLTVGNLERAAAVLGYLPVTHEANGS